MAPLRISGMPELANRFNDGVGAFDPSRQISLAAWAKARMDGPVVGSGPSNSSSSNSRDRRLWIFAAAVMASRLLSGSAPALPNTNGRSASITAVDESPINPNANSASR